MLHRGRFFEVPRTTYRTAEGAVEVPILYYDVSTLTAFFLVPRANAVTALDGTGLEPGLAFGQRALVALSFYEYRDTSVGVYNEVGTAVFAARRGERRHWLTPAVWVVDLPVTTAAAYAAGREIWGYPKFVTTIGFQLHGRDFEGVVDSPSGRGPIMTLAGRMGLGVPAPALSFDTYTRQGGTLLRTHIDVRGMNKAHRGGTLRVKLGTSTHKMVDNLRMLGLDEARPVVVLQTDRFQSKLHAGMAIG
ncbi:MAG: acetoacetate decarboxylase family protein [Myxococcales bacterium]